MGNSLVSNVLRFLLLLFFQVMVFNKVNLLGFIALYPYVLYIILFPPTVNKKVLIVSSFLLGHWVDLSLDSGGVHAMASLVLSYYRGSLFNLFFGASYDNQTLDLKKGFSLNVLKYMAFFVLLHHLIVQVFSIFSFTHFGDILLRTILSSAFTLLAILGMYFYFRTKVR